MTEAFYYDNDIVVDANGVTTYGLRSYAGVSYSFGEPIIEVIEHFNNTKGDYFDPLLSLVISVVLPTDDASDMYGVVTGTPVTSAKLYYCHSFGSDYVELADYGDMFSDEYKLAKVSLTKGDELDLVPLIELYNKVSIFISGKIAGLRSK